MNSVQNDTMNVNAASEGESLEPTAAEEKVRAEFDAAREEVVNLAVATLDPKDMLKKYAKLGAAVIKLALKRKSSFKAWAKQDFDKVCDQVEEIVRQRVPIKEVEMDKYVRIHLWVEAVKPLVPDVEKLSFFQVKNKFLPTLAFDAVELTGEIRKEWLTWVRTTVERQLGEDKLTMADLDASIKERKEEIERERLARSKRTPEEVLEAELKAANNKKLAERNAAQTKVLKAIGDALSNGLADVADIADVFGKAAKGYEIDAGKVVSKFVEQSEADMPGKLVGFDPRTATIDDCKVLASALCDAGKVVEMKYLRDRLDAMIKIAENAMVTSRTA